MQQRFVEKQRSKNNLSLEEGRFSDVKELRTGVGSKLPEDSQKDRGLIRKEIETAEISGREELPEEKKEQILNRALNRYFLKYKIGEVGNNTCVDAIHSSMANTGEIINILKSREDFQDLTEEGISSIIKLEGEINKVILEYFKKGNDTIGSIVKQLRESEKYKDDKLTKVILGIKNLHEDYTGSLASIVMEYTKGSGMVAKFVRRYLDANRSPDSRKIKKQDRLEFGYGYHLAQYCFLQKIFRESLGQKEEGKVEQPFLHISLHGKSNKPGDAGDVIISNAVRDGVMPCDPQIARWFSDKLNDKLQAKGVTKNSGERYTSGVALEGDRFCGNIVNCDRRFGKKEFSGMSLGKNYQFIQIELSPFIRKNYFEKLQKIIGEILQDFQMEFITEEGLERYLKENKTEEDKFRLEGKLYKKAGIYAKGEIKEGEVALSKNLRAALGITVGDKANITKANGEEDQFKIVGARKINNQIPRIPMFADNQGIADGQEIIVSRTIE
jgi:hypothetical protein